MVISTYILSTITMTTNDEQMPWDPLLVGAPLLKNICESPPPNPANKLILRMEFQLLKIFSTLKVNNRLSIECGDLSISVSRETEYCSIIVKGKDVLTIDHEEDGGTGCCAIPAIQTPELSLLSELNFMDNCTQTDNSYDTSPPSACIKSFPISGMSKANLEHLKSCQIVHNLSIVNGTRSIVGECGVQTTLLAKDLIAMQSKCTGFGTRLSEVLPSANTQSNEEQSLQNAEEFSKNNLGLNVGECTINRSTLSTLTDKFVKKNSNSSSSLTGMSTEQSDQNEHNNQTLQNLNNIRILSVVDESVSHVKNNNNRVDRTLCSVCGKSVYDLKTHMKRTHGESKHCCLECGKHFKLKTNLARHMNSVHMKKYQFHCEICQRRFSLKLWLSEHIESVHNEGNPDQKTYFPRVYPCTRCNKSFKGKTTLKHHVESVHDKIKSFACKTCGKCFNRNYHLQIHERTHTNLRPFTCDICTKMFKSKENCKMHMDTVHCEIQRFKCQNCNKGFSRKQLYEDHLAERVCMTVKIVENDTC
ncbi:uncharacterized protein LOC141899245 [Tubulanus polymorphus]|uniref:uncharacterized protein LOC141899245 n=1 Tax=Tubulanus polymorphus TaxID=672921 RepID=UPI003DA3FFA6